MVLAEEFCMIQLHMQLEHAVLVAIVAHGVPVNVIVADSLGIPDLFL